MVKRSGALSSEKIRELRWVSRKMGWSPTSQDVWHLLDTIDDRDRQIQDLERRLKVRRFLHGVMAQRLRDWASSVRSEWLAAQQAQDLARDLDVTAGIIEVGSGDDLLYQGPASEMPDFIDGDGEVLVYRVRS